MERNEATFDVFDDAMRLFSRAPDFLGSVNQAIHQATDHRYRNVGIEHLIRVLVKDDRFAKFIEATGGNLSELCAALDRCFDLHAATQAHQPKISELRFDETLLRIGQELRAYENTMPEPGEFEELAISLALREITSSAVAEAAVMESGADGLLEICETIDLGQFTRPSRKDEEEIGREILDAEFERMLDEASSDVDELFARQGKGYSGRDRDLFDRRPAEAPTQPNKSGTRRPAPKGAVSKLFQESNEEDAKEVDAALRDLKREAIEGHLPSIHGREAEIDRIVASLRRWRKGSIVVVGEPGTGKTALAEGLAQRFAAKALPEGLQDRPFYELSLTGLLANTRYRGEFESRIRTFINRVTKERAIIFIDEIHMLMGVGSSNMKTGGFDAANLLKPALARGEIAIIGATTPTEMRVLRQDEALMRRFEVMHLKEPTREETLEILLQSGKSCMDHHGVQAGTDVLMRICEITDLYQPERRFPDKAFDLLDMSCLVASDEGAELRHDHVDAAADRLGLHRPMIPDGNTLARLDTMPDELATAIPGQGAAIGILRDKMVEQLLKPRQSGPRAAFLLAGRSGAGKAAAAQNLAERMRLPLVTIDMSEIGHEGGKAHLLGMKGGLFHEMPGLLTEALETHRDVALVLRGIEAGDHEAIEVITSLLETGVLRSGQGREFSLRGSIVFAMSDSGRDDFEGRPGFNIGREPDPMDGFLPAAALARLGAPIWFADPSSSAVHDVAETVLDALIAQIERSGVSLQIEPEAREALLAENAGAKDLQVALEDRIMPMLVRHFVTNPMDRAVLIRLEDDRIACAAA